MVDIHEEFTEIFNTLHNLKETMSTLNKKIKILEKHTQKQQKKIIKIQQKQKREKKKPSGFATPTPISNSLRNFLDKPYGTQVARTEVTKYIVQYIKDHDLQNKENRKLINPDTKLMSLLELNPKDTLNYFNLQSFMNKHFIKNHHKNESYMS